MSDPPPNPVAKHCIALVIGVDQYPNLGPRATLHGAVKDSENFRAFVEKSFPGAVVTHLTNADASRAKILDAIRALTTNSAINNGDTIIIFFAGHGTSFDNPTPETGRVRIEAIVPSDATPEGFNPALHSIQDQEIAPLINELSRSKGNNITLIFDSCHSGGANRIPGDELPENLTRHRFLDGLEPPSPEAFESDPSPTPAAFLDRVAKTPSAWHGQDRASHVLLAACLDNEYSSETHGSGVFTTALVSILNTSDLLKMDYDTLIKHPKLRDITKKYKQTPMCDGANINRALFHMHIPTTGPPLMKGYVENSMKILNAGEAHGIWEGADLQVVDQDLDPFIKAQVSSVSPTTSTLKCAVPDGKAFPDPFGARLIGRHPEESISVYCRERSQLEDLLLRVLPSDIINLAEAGIMLTDDSEKADVVVSHNDDSLAFVMGTDAGSLKEQLPLCGTTTLAEADAALRVLQSVARFRFHLQRSPSSKSSLEPIRVRLELEERHWMSPSTARNILNDDGTVTLLVKDEDEAFSRLDPITYGLTVVNQSRCAIYLHVFLFNGSDLSIDPWDRPPVNAATDSKMGTGHLVQPGGKFHFGHGDNGIGPKRFVLEESIGLDITWCKVYATTEPGAFSFLAQESPFEEGEKDDSLKFPRDLPRKAKDVPVGAASWGTAIATIIQRRAVPDVLDDENTQSAFPVLGEYRPKPSPLSTATSADVKNTIGLKNIGKPKGSK